MNRSLRTGTLASCLALAACVSQSPAHPGEIPTERQGSGEPFAFPIPTTLRNPAYPVRAAKDGVSGEVRLRFDVDPEGRVHDVEVIESQPPGVFDESAKRALAEWRYRPTAGPDGRPTWVRNVRIRLLFRPR